MFFTPGGGYSDIFIHTCSAHFFGFKILKFNNFLGFKKNKYFFSLKRFWGHHIIGLYLGVIFMHFRVFS